MKYIHLFQTQQEHDAAYSRTSGKYIEPWLAKVKNTDFVTYNLPPIDWSKEYLTLQAIDSGTFKIPTYSCNYSIDEGKTWVALPSNTNTPTISAGNRIMFKATNTPSEDGGVGNFAASGRFNAMGNPYSLLYGDDFGDKIDLTEKRSALYGLFRGCTNLISAENLSLPATTLAPKTYMRMFSGCTSLTHAPELPATSLGHSAYTTMFAYCTSLTTTPKLPATTLASYCYAYMFNGCTSLTAAPELKATTLASQCYTAMFLDCTSLTNAPELPAMTLAEYCYQQTFKGCTALTEPAQMSATTLANGCYRAMYNGCSSLTTAPELPATTLLKSCYEQMFYHCTSLNYIKAMFTTTPSTAYTSSWVSEVAQTGTFVKNSAAQWDVTGANGIPTGWTVQTASS